jgi:hypothetical protein
MLRPAAVDPVDDADEGFDMRHFGRSVAWAGFAFVAMLGAFAAARSETGLRRINHAINLATGSTLIADASQRSGGGPALADADAEARRLARVVQSLTVDRERVLARLAVLERSVDVTGSLPPPGKSPPAPEARTGSTEPADGKVVASVTLIPPGGTNAHTILAGPTPPIAPQADGRLLPSAAPNHVSSGHAAADSVVTHTQFGIDLGSEADIEAVRTLWSMIKAKHGDMLDGLRPIVSTRDTERRGVVALHLIAGPLDNAAAAARLCAILGATGRTCRPSTFDGQRLALR